MSKGCPMTKVAEWTAIAAAVIVSYKVVHAIQAKGTSTRKGKPDVIPAELTESKGADPFLCQRLRVAVDLAYQAGSAVKAHIDGGKAITNKGKFDLVTETDQANEKLIFDGLRKAFPTDLFIGEESSAESGSIATLTDAATWIVDPIDGTTNFVHGVPLTCVSIGLTVDKETRLGVVYDPCADEMFVSMKGYGSFVNGKRASVSGCQDMETSVIITEYGYQRNPAAVQHMMDASAAILSKARALRQLGSGAIDLCWVGCGRTDGVYAGVAGEGWKPWDYVAGGLFAEEAGATLLRCNGQPFDLFGESVLCMASKALADEVVKTIAPHVL